MIRRAVAAMSLFALVTPAALAGAGDIAAGAMVAGKHCARCHGVTGKGDGEELKRLNADVRPVDWTNRVEVTKWSDQDMARIIVEGGKGVGKSKVMPAFRGKLSDGQVADLIVYIRSLAE